MNPVANNNTPDPASLTRTQKLAVLMLVLGPDSASSIMKQFDEKELQAVSAEMAKFDIVSYEMQRAVLNDFAQVAVHAGSSVTGGSQVVRATLEKAVGTNKASAIVSRFGGDSDTADFMIPMIESDPRELLNVLKTEQPQTIALIASHLPQSQAKALLNECPSELRDKVIERLASLSPTSIEVMEKIASIINRKLGFKATRAISTTGGLKPAADLLNNLNRDVSKAVLISIEERNPELGKAIRQKMFTFDDMVLLDNAGLQKVMREVDTRDLALSLKKATEPVKAALFGAISKRAAETVKEEISFLNAVKPKEMEAAQQRIVDIVRRLEGEGEIEINRGGEETKSNEVMA